MAQSLNIILISAVVSGIISIIVNTISYFVRRRIRQADELKKRTRDWHTNVISLSRQIRRKGLEIKYNVPIDPDDKSLVSDDDQEIRRELDSLNSLISDLESELDNAPPELRDSEVAKEIRELCTWYNLPKQDQESFTTTHLKKEIVLLSEDIMDQVYESSDEINSLPY